MMRASRLSRALFASAALHLVLLLALASGNRPALPGMPGDALRVSLLAPQQPGPGAPQPESRKTAGHGRTLAPAVVSSRTGPSAARTSDDSTPATTPHAGVAHDAETATTARALQSLVYEALAAHFSYPPLARENGWQGEVRLGMRIEPGGRIGRIQVIAGSGYGILDRAALRSLRAVGRVPRAAELLGNNGFDLVLPVRYRLLDG